MKTRQIAGEHSIFACFTEVEHLNQLSVPTCHKAMTAVYLKLVGLTVILLLQKIAGMVVILDIS